MASETVDVNYLRFALGSDPFNIVVPFVRISTGPRVVGERGEVLSGDRKGLAHFCPGCKRIHIIPDNWGVEVRSSGVYLWPQIVWPGNELSGEVRCCYSMHLGKFAFDKSCGYELEQMTDVEAVALERGLLKALVDADRVKWAVVRT